MKPNILTDKGWVTLQNATEVGYEMTMNELYTASFSLPVYDPACDYCTPFALVDIYDGDLYIGRFRISGESTQYRDDDATREYSLEHVIAFLADSRIIADSEYKIDTAENSNFPGEGGTRLMLKKMLAWQDADNAYVKSVKNMHNKNEPTYWWALGDGEIEDDLNEIDDDFKISDSDILSSIFQVLDGVGAYYFEYDTSTAGTQENPWLIHVREFTDKPTAYVTYGMNEVNIQRSLDTSEMCTRLYCVGGKAENSDTETYIVKDKDSPSSIGTTPAGHHGYIEGNSPADRGLIVDGRFLVSTKAEEKYGAIVRTYTESDVTNGKTLRIMAEVYLMNHDHPQYDYDCDIVDMYRYEGTNLMQIGTCVRVSDALLNADIVTNAVSVSKEDVDGDPLAMKIRLSTNVTGHEIGLTKLTTRLLGGIK